MNENCLTGHQQAGLATGWQFYEDNAFLQRRGRPGTALPLLENNILGHAPVLGGMARPQVWRSILHSDMLCSKGSIQRCVIINRCNVIAGELVPAPPPTFLGWLLLGANGG